MGPAVRVGWNTILTDIIEHADEQGGFSAKGIDSRWPVSICTDVAGQSRRQDQYRRQEAERRRQLEEERLRLERERNELLRQQQQQQSAPQSADASLVKRTQSALTLLGFDIANVNGQLDESTATAIRSYQQSFGLLATGSPSQELLDHMKGQL